MNETPLSTWAWVVGAVLAALFGKPVWQGMMRRRTAEEKAGQAAAEADLARETATAEFFRNTDDASKILVARAERAEAAEARALSERDRVIAEKHAAIQDYKKMMDDAREDVHAVRGAAMEDKALFRREMAAARAEFTAELERQRHAHEAREAVLQGEIQMLNDRLTQRDELIRRLTENIDGMNAINERLQRQLRARGVTPDLTSTVVE